MLTEEKTENFPEPAYVCLESRWGTLYFTKGWFFVFFCFALAFFVFSPSPSPKFKYDPIHKNYTCMQSVKSSAMGKVITYH